MPARIVFDHPHGQLRSTVLRLVRAFLGSILIAVGLLASIVAIPTGFVTISDVIWQVSKEPEPLFSPGFPVRACELAFVVSALAAVLALRHGRRLVRGRRSMVLFLRRFGYRGSMQAVTFAVSHTIGTAWRLVTLDDAAIAPVGVTAGSRIAFGAGEWIARAVAAAGRGVFVAFEWTTGGMWLIVALQVGEVLLTSNWRRALNDGTVDTYAKIVASVMDGRVPIGFFAPTLPGLFALFATGVALSLGGLIVVMVVLLLSFPLFGVLMMATSSAQALRKAEDSKTQTIGHLGGVPDTVRAIARQGSQTFASRLVVVRVATAAWQLTVSELAALASVSIVDVSDATEHLVWELNELERRCPGRWIVIGEHARVVRWGNAGTSWPADSLDARFAACLESRDVLAYTTDRQGMRRFARALHGMLLDVEDGPDR